MLSAISSFIATYWSDTSTSLASIGGSAEDSITAPAPSCFGVGWGSTAPAIAELSTVVVVEELLLATAEEALLLATENNGSPASALGGGILSRGVPAGVNPPSG